MHICAHVRRVRTAYSSQLGCLTGSTGDLYGSAVSRHVLTVFLLSAVVYVPLQNAFDTPSIWAPSLRHGNRFYNSTTLNTLHSTE